MTTPKLTNWAGMLTLDGEALAAWLKATGTPIPPLEHPRATLLDPAAVYFRAHPDTAAALWQAFQRDMDSENTTEQAQRPDSSAYIGRTARIGKRAREEARRDKRRAKLARRQAKHKTASNAR